MFVCLIHSVFSLALLLGLPPDKLLPVLARIFSVLKGSTCGVGGQGFQNTKARFDDALQKQQLAPGTVDLLSITLRGNLHALPLLSVPLKAKQDRELRTWL